MTHSQNDYIFHFELDEGEESTASSDHPLVEMVREQLGNLLEIITLMKGDEEVGVDGFKFVCDDDSVYKLR